MNDDQTHNHEHDHPLTRRGPDNAQWYVVAHAVGMTQAEIPAGLLRTAGIPVYLFREALGSSAIPVSFGKLGGVQIAVPEAFYAEALALLEGDDDLLDELPYPDDAGTDDGEDSPGASDSGANAAPGDEV